jgi:hypothetical protein
VIKQGKCGNLERGQTESGKSERDQTLFHQIWNAVKQKAVNQNKLKLYFPNSESDKSKTGIRSNNNKDGNKIWGDTQGKRERERARKREREKERELEKERERETEKERESKRERERERESNQSDLIDHTEFLDQIKWLKEQNITR